LRGLKERGLIDNTLIVFLSDHGEEFFEHHGFEHGHTLYDELIKVPMILSLPGVLSENVRIQRQVRLLDVMPTILEMLDISPWTEPEGISLVPLMSGGADWPPSGSSLLPHDLALSEAILYGKEQKSLSAYPWKLIYNIKEDETEFFNLAEDPGETVDLSQEPSDSRHLLEQTLYRTLFNIDDTWFLELAGGDEGHTFDVYVTSEAVRGAGHFEFHRIVDARGNILSTDAVGNAIVKPSVIEIYDLQIKQPVTLALKLMQPKASVKFDLSIDGRPAVRNSFIGADLAQPMTMPFEEKPPPPDSDDTSLGEPGERPETPYCLIWLYRSRYQAESAIELDPDTERELRSLGYIQ
jgi:hypothetical protein